MQCSPRLFYLIVVLSVTVIIYTLFHATKIKTNFHDKVWLQRIKPARRPHLINSTKGNVMNNVKSLVGNSDSLQGIASTSFSTTPSVTTSSSTSSTTSFITSSTPTPSTSTTTSSITSVKTAKTRLFRPTLVPIPVCGDQADLIDLNNVTPPGRPKVDLFIFILSAVHRSDRRQASRQTWLSTSQNYSLVYRFFTDGIGIGSMMMEKFKKEQEKYKDLELLPTKQGYWFTHRFLHAMFWGYERYNFSFYLRLDDDYFVCLNNLMNDLQYRKKDKLLYWGWLHCNPKIVNIDEGFLITSIDLVQEIIKRNRSLCCHPMGDQMIAMWINGLDHEGCDVTYFPDNRRLMHYRKDLRSNNDICKRVLGVHEAYPKQMHNYWNLAKDNWYSIKPDEFVRVERKAYSSYCKFPKGWDWRVLSTHWRHQPKPCWKPGVGWPELDRYKLHPGRERRGLNNEI